MVRDISCEIVDHAYGMLMDAVAVKAGGDSGGMWERWSETNAERGEIERWRSKR